jgi:hypothetical protein
VAISSRRTPFNRSRANPKRAGAFTHVEFIYTPVKAKFDCAFNELSAARLYGEQCIERKRVDDLDTSCPEDRFQAWWRTAEAPAAGVEALHLGHCVTLEPCPRCNMSHRRGCRGLWHGHCNYNKQKRAERARKVKNQNARDLEESMGSD